MLFVKILLAAIAILVLHTAFATENSQAADMQSVAVDGTAFVVTMADGRVMRSPELVGAILTIATAAGQLPLRMMRSSRTPTLSHPRYGCTRSRFRDRTGRGSLIAMLVLTVDARASR